MRAVLLMTRAAFRRRRLGGLLLVGAVVALATAGLAAALVLQGSAADRVDAAFERGDGPDLVVTVDPTSAEMALAHLATDPDILRFTDPVPVIEAQAIVGADRFDLDVRAVDPSSGTTLNAPVMQAGRLPTTEGEILMDAALADSEGIDVGDTVEVVGGGGTVELEVVGLGYDFTDCLYPTCDPAHGWTTTETVDRLDQGGERASLIAVDVADGDDAEAVATRLRGDMGEAVGGSNTWEDTRGDMIVEAMFFSAFLGTFGVFVLISSGVVIAGAIAARTVARRRTIGLYKAVGCSTGQVGTSILAEHLAIGVAACLVGNAVAAALAPELRVGSLRILEGSDAGISVSTVAVSTAVVVVVITLATVVPAWRAGRTPVTAALRDAPVRGRRRPRATGRVLLSVSAVAIAVVASVVALSIDRSVDHILAEPQLAGDPGDATVTVPDSIERAEAERTLDELPVVAGWYSLVDDRAEVNGVPVHLRAIGGDPADAGFVIGEGEPLQRPGQAIAGYGLMDGLGGEVGDTVAVEIDRQRLDVTVVGWYRETEDTGEVLQIRMEDYERAHADVRPSYAVIGTSGSTPQAVAAGLADAFGETARIGVHEPDADQLRPFTIALSLMTALIGSVAVAHLVAAALTTSRERARRTGILRAIGLDNRGLVAEVATSAAMVAVAGTAVGLVLGWVTQQALGDLLTTALGAGPGLTLGPSAAQVAVVVAAVVALGVAANVAASLPVLRRPTHELVRED